MESGKDSLSRRFHNGLFYILHLDELGVEAQLVLEQMKEVKDRSHLPHTPDSRQILLDLLFRLLPNKV